MAEASKEAKAAIQHARDSKAGSEAIYPLAVRTAKELELKTLTLANLMEEYALTLKQRG